MLHAGPVEKRAEMIRVVFEDGREIVATPEHKFFTERGLVTSDALRYSDSLLTSEHPLCVTAASSLKESDTTGLREAVTTLAGSGRTARTLSYTFIERYMSIISDLFRRVCVFTTRITTGWTTTPKISNSWLTAIMPAITESTANGLYQSRTCCSSKRLRNEPRNGTQATKAGNGTVSTLGASQKIGSGMRRSVMSAVRSIARLIRRDRCTAIRIAKLQRFDAGGEWTYDLTVEKHQCYVTNGVLVSNSDATGYWLAWEEPVRSLDYGGASRMGYPHPKNPGYSTTKR